MRKNLPKPFTRLLGESKEERVVFLGRIGQGKPAYARSLRLSIKQLLTTHS